MRLKDIDGLHCSQLLVNSVLACASVSTQNLACDAAVDTNYLQLFSEVDGAFAEEGQLLTRGEHYHREAMRLCTLEEGKRSIANLQALLILAIE